MTQLSVRKATLLSRLARRSERGMTTAEYAVGTVAVVLFGGVLTKIFTDEWIQELIRDLILKLFETILRILGLGF